MCMWTSHVKCWGLNLAFVASKWYLVMELQWAKPRSGQFVDKRDEIGYILQKKKGNENSTFSAICFLILAHSILRLWVHVFFVTYVTSFHQFKMGNTNTTWGSNCKMKVMKIESLTILIKKDKRNFVREPSYLTRKFRRLFNYIIYRYSGYH